MVRAADRPMKHVLGFSGGIDSQAAARWLLNRYPPEGVILLFADPGGNEDPLAVLPPPLCESDYGLCE